MSVLLKSWVNLAEWWISAETALNWLEHLIKVLKHTNQKIIKWYEAIRLHPGKGLTEKTHRRVQNCWYPSVEVRKINGRWSNLKLDIEGAIVILGL